MAEVSERLRWYYFIRKPWPIIRVINILHKMPGQDETEARFHRWLAGEGYLGFPWANKVTLFMQLMYPDYFK